MKIQTSADAFYISDPSNLYYFSGYKNADAKILFIDEDQYYFTDARYFEEVESLPFVIKNIAEFYNFLKEKHIKTLATDVSLTVDEYALLRNNGIEKINNESASVFSLRAVKTEREIGFIKQAQEITDKTFSAVLSYVKEGMTEKESDRILKSLLYQNGADDLAFDPIVAFGNNTSKPHAHPGEARLKKGDLITFDFGAKYNGYCSDMTRTVAFGKPEEEAKKIYETVLSAQKAALDVLHAGMTGAEGQKIVTDFFEEKNVREYFTHSLGHSLGIDIHENPCLSARNNDPIPENAVLSVEPGLYFPKKFGVRIEDIVVFTKTGVRNLTNSEKKLIII